MSSVYTFITLYQGGTYIARFAADEVLQAAYRWADHTAQNEAISHLDKKAFRRIFEDEIGEYPPAPIDENVNVWGLFYFYGRNRLEVIIVKTDVQPEGLGFFNEDNLTTQEKIGV